MTLLWVVGLVLFLSFFVIVFRGAPFVPTKARDVEAVFSLYSFKKDDIFVDLGSGDGRMLVAAAERGIRAVGYELNPFLVWYSSLKLQRYRDKTTVKFADFWGTSLPSDTAVVFTFLAGPFMKKLDHKLRREATRLDHDIVLVSYGVAIADKTPETTRGGLLVYRYKPGT